MLTVLSFLNKTNPHDTPTRRGSKPSTPSQWEKINLISITVEQVLSIHKGKGKGKTKREFLDRPLHHVPNFAPLLTGVTSDEKRRRACKGREWRRGKRATTTKATGGSGHPAPPPPQLSLSPTHTRTHPARSTLLLPLVLYPAAAALQSCNLPISVNGFPWALLPRIGCLIKIANVNIILWLAPWSPFNLSNTFPRRSSSSNYPQCQTLSWCHRWRHHFLQPIARIFRCVTKSMTSSLERQANSSRVSLTSLILSANRSNAARWHHD